MAFQVTWPRELNRLQDEIQQVFGRGLNSPLSPMRSAPPINLWEDDDNLYVESEIPGMELEGFELLVNDESQLSIQGERKQPGDKSATWHRQERSFGRFSRMVPLPVPVDGNATSANYTAGVLRITLPKKAEAKPRRIAVTAN